MVTQTRGFLAAEYRSLQVAAAHRRWDERRRMEASDVSGKAEGNEQVATLLIPECVLCCSPRIPVVSATE
jgi:hypothetical protein